MKKPLVNELRGRCRFTSFYHEPPDFFVRQGIYGGPLPQNWEDFQHRTFSMAGMQVLKDTGINFVLTSYFKGYGLGDPAEGAEHTKQVVQNAHQAGIKVLLYVQFLSVMPENIVSTQLNIPDLRITKPDQTTYLVLAADSESVQRRFCGLSRKGHPHRPGRDRRRRNLDRQFQTVSWRGRMLSGILHQMDQVKLHERRVAKRNRHIGPRIDPGPGPDLLSRLRRQSFEEMYSGYIPAQVSKKGISPNAVTPEGR